MPGLLCCIMLRDTSVSEPTCFGLAVLALISASAADSAPFSAIHAEVEPASTAGMVTLPCRPDSTRAPRLAVTSLL